MISIDNRDGDWIKYWLNDPLGRIFIETIYIYRIMSDDSAASSPQTYVCM